MTYLGIGPANSAVVSTGTQTQYSTSPTMAGPFSCSGLTNSAFLGVKYMTLTTGVDPNPALVSSNNFYISVNSTNGAYTVDLPNSAPINQIYIIKDKMGTAATHNITVASEFGSALFDGQSSAVISTNYGSIRVIFNGTNYELF